MKYIEKTGEKIIYSRGLPMYVMSDIEEKDVATRTGIEDKKLLLFNEFNCWDEGVYIGVNSEETRAQLRKSKIQLAVLFGKMAEMCETVQAGAA